MEPRTLDALLAKPSHQHFGKVCRALDRLDDAELAAVMPSALERLAHWPDEIRSASVIRWKAFADDKREPAERWLWALFDDVFNPRLALLRRASLSYKLEYARDEEDPWTDDGWGKQTGESLMLALGRHLEPGFDFAPVVLSTEDEGTPFSDRTVETSGDPQRGVIHTSYTVEHACDYTSGSKYVLYGLGAGTALELEITHRSGAGTYAFEARGPAPAVLEVALAWTRIERSGPRQLDRESIAQIVARDKIRAALPAHTPAKGKEGADAGALSLHSSTGVDVLLDCEICPALDLETAQCKLEEVRGDYRICPRCLTVYLCRQQYDPPDFPPDWAVLAGVDTRGPPTPAEFRRLRPREAREQLKKTKWKKSFEENLLHLFKEMKTRLKRGSLSDDLRRYSIDSLADEGIRQLWG